MSGPDDPWLGSLLRHALAKDPVRPEDQDHDEEREGDEIAQLIGRGDADAVEEEGGAHGFHEAEEEAAEHGAGDAADAAQHGGAERLDARREVHEEIDLLEDEGIEDARDTRHGAAEREGE